MHKSNYVFNKDQEDAHYQYEQWVYELHPVIIKNYPKKPFVTIEIALELVEFLYMSIHAAKWERKLEIKLLLEKAQVVTDFFVK